MFDFSALIALATCTNPDPQFIIALDSAKIEVKQDMITFQVQSLDVLGHSSSDCHKHGCPCMKACNCDDSEEHGLGHDDNACECSYKINDVFSAGKIEVESSDDQNQGILDALIEGGYLSAGVTFEDIEFDDVGETMFSVNEKSDGQPLFRLERLE